MKVEVKFPSLGCSLKINCVPEIIDLVRIFLEHKRKNKCIVVSIEIIHTKFCTVKFQTIKLHNLRFYGTTFVESMFAMMKNNNQWKILIAIFSLIVFSSVEFHQQFGSSDSNFNCLELETDSEEEIDDDNHDLGLTFLPILSEVADFRLCLLVEIQQFKSRPFASEIYQSCPRYIRFEQLRVFS